MGRQMDNRKVDRDGKVPKYGQIEEKTPRQIDR